MASVAPCTGAWIEILADYGYGTAGGVAPCTGAWIEIKALYPTLQTYWVAPCTGAWIEITTDSAGRTYIGRRTLHGCVD